MKYSFGLRDKALKEINEAYEWYENQGAGLGDKFISELENYFNAVQQNPYGFKITYKIFREIPLKKFPFLIVYFIDNSKSQIIIISVFHTSRNPLIKFQE